MIFRVILFLIIIYYVLKLIGKIFLPIFLTHRIQKMEEEKQKAYRDYIARKKKEEGKITVDGKSNIHENRNLDKGEYVDFEEIK